MDVLFRGDEDERLLSRASALGWAAISPVTVVIGGAPEGHPEQVLDAVQRAARHAGMDVLAGVQGDRLVWCSAACRTLAGTRPLLPEFGPGPVVIGPTVTDLGAAGGPPEPRWPGSGRSPGWPVRRGRCSPPPAARAGAVRRRGGPRDPGRGRVPATRRGRLHAAGHGTAYAESGGTLEARPGRCSYIRIPSGTGCGGSPRCADGPRPFRASCSPCSSPWCSAGWRTRAESRSRRGRRNRRARTRGRR